MAQKIALFDIDGTLFRWQLFHELVFALKNQGLFDEATAQSIDEALLSWQARTTSWDDYEHTVMAGLNKHLAGMPIDIFEKSAQAVVENSGHKIYNYTKKLADSLKADGYFLLAITGSYQEVAEPFARRYGFDDCIGQLLERKNGVFASPDLIRIVYGQKPERIREYLHDKDFTLDGSVAVGDSGSDISMLEMADRPIAFNPSVELLDVALERNWQIVVERKNIAYSLEPGHGHVILAKTDRF